MTDRHDDRRDSQKAAPDQHPDRTPPDDVLEPLVASWKASTPAPPAHLEAHILDAVRAAKRREGADVAWFRPAAWPRPVWAAAGALAALLVIGSMLALRTLLLAPEAPLQAERLLVADALREAEAAEREHARAIAQLEQIAAPILARATDPELPGAQAARLMAFGNRLRFLNETIAEIDDFLNQNTGHAGGRTTLLAAYREKTEVLREVIALNEEMAS